MLLSDLLIFPLVYIFESRHKIIEKFPNIKTWMINLQSVSDVESVLCDILNNNELVSTDDDDKSSLSPAVVDQNSLYKSDPNRKAQTFTFSTKQSDISQVKKYAVLFNN